MVKVKFDTGEHEAILVYHDKLFYDTQVLRFENVEAAQLYAALRYRIPDTEHWSYADVNDNMLAVEADEPLRLPYWEYEIDETQFLSIHLARRVCEF
jgi:hypothetical protein